VRLFFQEVRGTIQRLRNSGLYEQPEYRTLLRLQYVEVVAFPMDIHTLYTESER